MSVATEGTLLWTPDPASSETSEIRRYMRWLADHKALHFDDYTALWQWSTDQIEDFWASLWEFFAIDATPYTSVLADRAMPGARWFEGATLNYAQHIFRNAAADHPAIMFQSERQPLTEISWAELEAQTAAIATALRKMGIRRGDRVVAYLPNIPHAVAALLACASIGAVWSSCSPDFGSPSVIDRWSQIAPKVMIAIDGYQYGGKTFDRIDMVRELQRALPSVHHTILIPYLNPNDRSTDLPNTVNWNDLIRQPADLTFDAVPFDHPLWIVYSSGTTGLPKPIVQGQGGILLEHLKSISLHLDLKRGDRFFWFTTTGWMMWNFLVGGLLVGSTMLIYDGSPAWPDLGTLWRFAEQTRMNVFGTSASYLTSCMKAGIAPGEEYDLSELRAIGSTGSPLSPEGFSYVYDRIRSDVWLVSLSGGTDLCTAFIGGCPLLPVYSGELQCRSLGANVQSFDDAAQPVIGEVGELVITAPMPSMPLYFWNDPDMQRYRDSYFDVFPGVWRHGDWIKITDRGSAIIYGRSDSTINRMGVRMGTSEFYRVVEALPEIRDSLVVDLEGLGQRSYMPLFVVLNAGTELTADLEARIRSAIRSALSPRHVPDAIYTIPDVPRTLSGKKLEVPIKKLFMGVPIEKAANPGAMANPQVLHYFVDLAARYQEETAEIREDTRR